MLAKDQRLAKAVCGRARRLTRERKKAKGQIYSAHKALGTHACLPPPPGTDRDAADRYKMTVVGKARS